MRWDRASAVVFTMILLITPGLLWAKDAPQVLKAIGVVSWPELQVKLEGD